MVSQKDNSVIKNIILALVAFIAGDITFYGITVLNFFIDFDFERDL